MQELKQQHIASLCRLHPDLKVAAEGNIYDVPCPLQGFTASLIVNLPPNFPDTPPTIVVKPTGMRHPWIDRDVIVHDSLGLSAWKKNNVDLGQLVQDIKDEFAARPPARKDTGLTEAPSEESYGHRPPPALPPSASHPPAFTQEEYEAINKKSPEEIEELLTNDTAFELFFNSLDRVKNLKTVQEELRSGNEMQAEKNLSHEQSLSELYTKLNQLTDEYQQTLKILEEKEKLQDEAFDRFSLSTLITRLKASVYESEDLSESVAQSFLDGNLDHDSFVKQFREFRKVYHLRASKLEHAQRKLSSSAV